MAYKNKADKAAAQRAWKARQKLGQVGKIQRAREVAPWRLTQNALISETPEVRAFKNNLIARMPSWREEQIQKAHAAFLKEKKSQPRTSSIIFERN